MMTFHSQLNTFHSQLFLESHNPFMVPVSTNQIYTHFKSGFKSPTRSLPNVTFTPRSPTSQVPRHNVVLNSTPVSSIEAGKLHTFVDCVCVIHVIHNVEPEGIDGFFIQKLKKHGKCWLWVKKTKKHDVFVF